ARLDDGIQRTAFVRRVALHGLDQVGHEVVAALELNVDVRPGRVRLYAPLDERVVDHENGEDRRNQDQQRPHGGFLVRDNEWGDLPSCGYGCQRATVSVTGPPQSLRRLERRVWHRVDGGHLVVRAQLGQPLLQLPHHV